MESKITWSIEVLEYSNESETLDSAWKLWPGILAPMFDQEALAKASAVQAKGLESKITWSIEVLEYSNESGGLAPRFGLEAICRPQ